MEYLSYRKMIGPDHYEPFICKLSSYPQEEIVIKDLYCVNPERRDHSLELQFYANREDLDFLFAVIIGKNNTIEQRSLKAEGLDIDSIVDEFLLHDLYKGEVQNRKKIVANKLKKSPYQWIPLDNLDDRQLGSYQRIFGSVNNDRFSFVYQNKEYVVEDLYCMNVDCDCREALLLFIEKNRRKPLFSFYVDIDTLKCRMNYCRLFFKKKRAHEIGDHYIEELKTSRFLLKNRYQSLKRLGRYLRKKKKKKRKSAQ